MRIVVLIVAAALGLAGCAQPVAMQTKFDYAEHKRYTDAGSSNIKGQGFLRQQGGGIVTCAGGEVFLTPATPFFREFFGHIRAGRVPQSSTKIDPAYKSMVKQSQCDAQGNFSFNQLPSGAWFVATEVRWAVGYRQQGGYLMREVTLASGETAQVLLTDKDFIGR